MLYPMLIDLSRSTNGIVVLGRALGDFEVAAWDDDVGGVCRARPFLAVDAVAGERHGVSAMGFLYLRVWRLTRVP